MHVHMRHCVRSSLGQILEIKLCILETDKLKVRSKVWK